MRTDSMSAAPPFSESMRRPADLTTDGTPPQPLEVVEPGPEQRARWAEARADAAERRTEALERALTHRATIDQAKGVLMGAFGLDPEAAFDALVWVSQHANLKLALIAEAFLATIGSLEVPDTYKDQLTALLAGIVHEEATRSA